MVHLRLISLENAPPDFAQLVTKATNTQKNIVPRDFASLDRVQRQLAHEFSLDGRTYVYRQGDPSPPASSGCTIDEVAAALACQHSLEMSVVAYRNAGMLVDPDSQPYRTIFGPQGRTKADEAWLAVQILRASERALNDFKENRSLGRGRQVATHGATYVQYRVMNDSLVKALRGRSNLRGEEIDAVVRAACETHFKAVCDHIATKRDNEYLQVLFKNTKRVKAIEDALADRPPEGPIRYAQPDLFAIHDP